MLVGRHAAVCGVLDVRMLEQIVFAVDDGSLAADEQQRVVVVQILHLLRRHQLTPGKLTVGGEAAVSSARSAVGVQIDRLLAQSLGDIFMGGLLVAAEVQEGVAVADDGFPFLFKQRLELRHVLQDDGDRNAAAADGGHGLVELIRQGDIGELVHDEVDGDRQFSVVHVACLIGQLLEQLRIQHADQEIEAAVVVRDDREKRGLPLAHMLQLQIVALGDAGQRIQIEFLQSGEQRDLDGFQRFGTAGAVATIVFQGDVIRFVLLQLLKQNVQRRLEPVVILPHLSGADQLQNHGEVLLLRRSLVAQIEHQRHQQHHGGLIPERILALTALGRGILKDIRDHALHVVVIAEIDKRIVAMAALHVDQIDNLNDVTPFFQMHCGVAEKLALRVENDEAGVCLHDVRLGEKARLACAAAADNQDVQVSHVAVHFQRKPHVLRQNNVSRVVGIGVFLVRFFHAAPFGGAVLLPAAVVPIVREIHADQHGVDQQRREDSPKTVLAKSDLKRMLKYLGAVRNQPQDAEGNIRRNQKRAPDDRESAENVE